LRVESPWNHVKHLPWGIPEIERKLLVPKAMKPCDLRKSLDCRSSKVVSAVRSKCVLLINHHESIWIINSRSMQSWIEEAFLHHLNLFDDIWRQEIESCRCCRSLPKHLKLKDKDGNDVDLPWDRVCHGYNWGWKAEPLSNRSGGSEEAYRNSIPHHRLPFFRGVPVDKLQILSACCAPISTEEDVDGRRGIGGCLLILLLPRLLPCVAHFPNSIKFQCGDGSIPFNNIQ